MIEFATIVSYVTHVIIFVGLYLSILWVLITFNSKNTEKILKLGKYPGVTIVAPAYNEENGIEATIESCLKTKYKGRLDIIVISDGSSDKTVEKAKKYKDKIRILDLKKNRGKAGALNVGLKYIKTEYFAVIDADTKVVPDTVENAIYCFEVNKRRGVGAVVCRMKPYNDMINYLERIQLLEYMIVGLVRFLSSQNQLLDMTNGGTFYKTSVVKEVGGFDENNVTEDFEMGVKIRRSGYRVAYSREAHVFTKTPSNLKMHLKQRIRWARGFIQTHSKHRDIFFNKKFGIYGFYQFPFNVIGPFLYFLAVMAISFKIYQKLYEFIYKLIYTPDLIEWFSFGTFRDYMLGLNPKTDLIIVASFLFLMFFYFGVNVFYRDNYFRGKSFKKLVSFIIYIMIYNYIYIYVWPKSIYMEFKRKGYDWGTK